MASCSIFEEDEVCIPTSTGGFKYGLVVESSEYISSDEDDDEFENRVQKGTVKVAWHPSGDETVVAEKKLILTDRSLMPGDVVQRLVSEKDSQCGFVEKILVKCHLKILGTEQWIYNVDVADVTTMQEWDTESEVTLDSWVGQLYEIQEDVTVRFPDGARCILKDAGMSNLEDINDKRSDHSEFEMRNFYPGQELCGTREDFEGAKWIHTTQMRGPDSLGAKALYTVPVIVEKVEISGVDVRWLCKGFTRAGSEKDALESPLRHVEGDRLKSMKIMDCFKHCHHQIGDKGYYVVKETDTMLRNMSPRQHYTPDIIQKMSKDNITVIGTGKDGLVVAFKGTEKEDGKTNEASKVPVENGLDNATAEGSCIVDNDEENDGDDEFEDGDGVDGGSDNSSDHSGGNSSPVMRRKTRKRPCLKGLKSLRKMRGKQAKKKLKPPERVVNPGDKVPVEIWYTFSSCDVMWQDGTIEETIPSPELFPVHHLDEFEYFPGDFVVDTKGNASTDYGVVVSCDHKERTCMVKWMKPYFPGKSQRPEEGELVEVSVYDIKDHPDYKFRPGNTVIRVGGFEGTTEDLEAVGQVYKLDPDGAIHIWWPNNTITKSYPQDLFLISDDMSGVNSSDDWSESDEEEEDDDEDSDVSWETEGEESADTEEEKEEETKKNNQCKILWTCDDGKKKDLDELLQRVQAAVTGLLDVFLNVPGPFFKNSKQVFQDILAIFKRCKEMEKLMKSSFFNEPEISNLISEIKEELRKENTTKLARHVATLYKYRTAASSETENADKTERDKAKVTGTVEECNENNIVSGVSSSMSNLETVNNGDKSDSGNTNILQNGVSSNGTSAASGGVDVDSLKEEEESTRQKLRKALLDYGTHIDDPVLQIIFDTSLHLAVVNSAKKKLETRSDSKEGRECYVKGAENQTKTLLAQKLRDSSDKSVSDESIEEVIESAIMSVCSGDQDSAEVAALKVSAKRKVEEMCCTALANSVSTSSAHEFQSSEDIQVTSSVIPKFQSSLDSQSSHIDSQTDSVLTQDKVKTGIENQSGDSAEKAELPTSHRNLCVRVCKALNTRLYHIQQEVNRKWLAYKFGCDENASDAELFEKMQAKMIESHEKEGKPLSLLESQTVETKSDANSEGNVVTAEMVKCLKNEIDPQSVSDLLNKLEGELPNEKHESDKKNDLSKDSEMDSLDSEGAAGATLENGEVHPGHSGFELCSEVCSSHWFKFQEQKPANQKAFTTAVRKELMLLQTHLPEGILVKTFEDRMDLFSVMIVGPAKTPYEDGLFAFDVQLPANFPSLPPVFHYLSYCNERLNPNLYEDGKVCVSLLGTWSGKGNEMWTSKSNLLQVLVSIQGLILVSEPYFNEAGYEKQRGTQHGQENSRMYNEMAILKLVQSMTKLALTPPTVFATEARDHLNKNAARMIKRLESWIELSTTQKNLHSTENQSETEAGTSQQSHDQFQASENTEKDSLCDRSEDALPDFPLLPASKGFCLTLKKHLDNFKTVLKEHIWTKDVINH